MPRAQSTLKMCIRDRCRNGRIQMNFKGNTSNTPGEAPNTQETFLKQTGGKMIADILEAWDNDCFYGKMCIRDRVSTLARQDMEKFMGTKVYLETWVKAVSYTHLLDTLHPGGLLWGDDRLSAGPF